MTKRESLPKVLEHLQHFLGCLISIPISPLKQCRFMQDIQAAHKSIYLQITFKAVNLQFNIILRDHWALVVDRKLVIFI